MIVIYWNDILRLIADWVIMILVLIGIMVILYLAARLVFHAWLKTKQYFKEKG